MNVKIPASVSKAAARCLAGVKKASPEIALISGLVGIVGTTVFACRRTRKLDDILEKNKAQMDAVRKRYEDAQIAAKRTVQKDGEPAQLPIVYTEKQKKKDTAKVYLNVAWDMTKLYGPVLLAEAASIGLVLLSHHQLKLKNASLSAALSSITVAFNEYRNRVRAELGEEQDRKFRYGISSAEIGRITEDGEVVKETVDICEISKQDLYMRYYSPEVVRGIPMCRKTRADGTPVYDEHGRSVMIQDIEASLFQIHAAEDRWQKIKDARPKRRVYFNEVLLDMGYDSTDAGQDVGWAGDSKLDFRPQVVTRIDENGKECPTIVLDFNCDGCVRDEALKAKRALRFRKERGLATA